MSRLKSENHVSRVDQLDASALDGEFLTILRSSLIRACEELHPRWLLHFESDVTALLKLILWKFTVMKKGSTIGQRLLLLEYHNASGQSISRKQGWLLATLLIGGQWLNDKARLDFYGLARPGNQVSDVWKWLQTFTQLAGLVNYLLFLRFGCYRSLPERVVGVTSGNAGPKSIRQVQYEFMNRELLWHGLADFLTFIIPLVNMRRIRNRLSNFLFPGGRLKSSPLEREYSDLTCCAYCQESPIFPHDIGCKHVFCHYCIQSNVLADSRFQCPRCSNRAEGVDSVRPVTAILNPDY